MCAPGGAESNVLFPIDNRDGEYTSVHGRHNGRPYDVKVMFTMNFTFNAKHKTRAQNICKNATAGSADCPSAQPTADWVQLQATDRVYISVCVSS